MTMARTACVQTRRLARIGGNNVPETVRRVMKACFTNALAQNFNWLGKGVKQAFCFTRLRLVVFG